mgnify:CR=1 FL=1
MTLKTKIQELSELYFEDIRQIRRTLHANPELSFNEHETSGYIKQNLEEIGIAYREISDTGITGEIKGNKTGNRVIAVRADIDALPVEEKNNVTYTSKNPGIMHACGHDAHTASLIGALKILKNLQDDFGGTIKFIFQPAEEKLPGGAQELIKAGVLENPRPDLIIGQHVYPDLPARAIGYRPGPYMASTDEIFLTIQGKGGHGAMPHKINDTVLAASQTISTLHQNIHRFSPASIPTVLSFGKVIANGATNVIPDEVRIDGTFRTMNEKWRQEAHQMIKTTAESISKTQNTHCTVEIKKGYPVLHNDEKVTTKAMEISKSYLGKQHIEDLDIRMTAEDFAYYTQEIPGTFFRLGTGNTINEPTHPLHSSNFNIDEEALKTGMGHLAWLAMGFLKEVT